MDTETVTGDELRHGDYIYTGESAFDGFIAASDHIGVWNVYVVIENGVKGHRGSTHGTLEQALSGGMFKREPRFSGSRVFKVRSPRPSPATNEFGPVIP
jgi:hypothetical protein